MTDEDSQAAALGLLSFSSASRETKKRGADDRLDALIEVGGLDARCVNAHNVVCADLYATGTALIEKSAAPVRVRVEALDHLKSAYRSITNVIAGSPDCRTENAPRSIVHMKFVGQRKKKHVLFPKRLVPHGQHNDKMSVKPDDVMETLVEVKNYVIDQLSAIVEGNLVCNSGVLETPASLQQKRWQNKHRQKKADLRRSSASIRAIAEEERSELEERRSKGKADRAARSERRAS